MKISKELGKLTTTQSEMARTLGITQQRVSQLAQDEIMKKDKSGALLVIPSLKNFYKFKAHEDGGAGGEENLDYDKEKALHERAKRRMAELLLRKKENSVYEAKHVELVLIEMMSTLRTQLLGLPSKLAPMLENQDKGRIYEFLMREIEEKLMELSEYSPELFTEEELEDESAE